MKLLELTGTPPGDYIYELEDKSRVLARVRRLPSRPGHLGLVVKVCGLTGNGEMETVNGEVVWTRQCTTSMGLAGMLADKASVAEQVTEAVERAAAALVEELEASSLAMGVLTEIPFEDESQESASLS